jgi:uncharacterized protein YndB with AHSA1/START domain/DNA-binding transcriptional ArsR family regulator
MKEQSVIHATYAIRRNYPVPRQRVFAAFSDPAKKRRWFAEGERAAMEEFQMDFRVGGQERTRSRLGENSPFPGALLGNDTTYQDIVPERRIVLAYTMAIGDRRISASLATFEFFPAEEGTELVFPNKLHSLRAPMARRCVKRDGASCSTNWPGSWPPAIPPPLCPATKQEGTHRRHAMLHPRAVVDRVFHALGDPTRRMILEKLSQGPVSVSNLAGPLDITLAAVVQHLQVLEKSGLVRTEKAGRVRTCRMEPKGLTVAEQWISQRRLLWEKRLDRLGELLAEPE